MSREVHVRFCESPGVRFPRATRLREGRRVELYQFVLAEKETFDVRTMCQVLEISASDYYEWQAEQESAHAQRDGELRELVRSIFADSKAATGRLASNALWPKRARVSAARASRD